MKIIIFLIFSVFLYPEVKTEGTYVTVDVEYVNMTTAHLQEWNGIQQDQIDILEGKVNDLIHNNLLVRADMFNLAEYTVNNQAGETAMSNIDFGNIAKGHFSIGLGYGYAETINGFTGDAGALGFRYNFGDITILKNDITIQGTAKGWTTGSHAGGGFGFTFGF